MNIREARRAAGKRRMNLSHEGLATWRTARESESYVVKWVDASGFKQSEEYPFDLPEGEYPEGTVGMVNVPGKYNMQCVRVLKASRNGRFECYMNGHTSGETHVFFSFTPIELTAPADVEKALDIACERLTEFDICVEAVCPSYNDCDPCTGTPCAEAIAYGFKKEAANAR